MGERKRIKIQIERALKTGPKDFWQLINLQDSHITAFFQILKELEESGEVVREGDLYRLADPNKVIHPLESTICHHCSGTGLIIDGLFKEVEKRFLEITKNRPLPVGEFDQGFVRPQDTLRRMVFMYQRGDLEGREIFILGDDDLLSVAIGLTGLAKRITVVEIDKRLVEFIEAFGRKHAKGLITVQQYNVLEPLPAEEEGKYEVCITDPVETHRGFRLFVTRCLSTLNGPGAAAYVGLTHLEASLKKWHEYQLMLNDAGLAITDIIRDFAYYPEEENQWEGFYDTYEIMRREKLPLPKVDWYRSSFVRAEVVEPLNLPKIGEVSPETLYFDEESWATPLYPEEEG
jgi:predicted methyltransferase